jgi:hypothetical protein
MNEPSSQNSPDATHVPRSLQEALSMSNTSSKRREKSSSIKLAPESSPDGVAALENDPLLCKMELPLRVVFYPLGFAVEISTNSQAVLDAARESWKNLSQRHSSPMLRMGIAVTTGESGDCPPSPVVRAHRQLLTIVANPENQAVCDLGAGYAYAWLTHGSLLHRRYLRYHYIEAIALILISNSYATAIHAACVSRHGRGMLLCGDTGAGKSTLAYACARAGWTYTSDDACYLLRATGQPRVAGNSRQIRFRPSASDLFPELRGRAITPRAEGKPSIEVPTSELGGLVTEDEAPIDYIIFLNRQTSAGVDLLPFSRTVAMRRFHQSLFPEDEVQQLRAAALERLSTAEVYELRYRDLQQAVDRLERLARCPSASLRAVTALASAVI